MLKSNASNDDRQSPGNKIGINISAFNMQEQPGNALLRSVSQTLSDNPFKNKVDRLKHLYGNRADVIDPYGYRSLIWCLDA